jgi:hypothetical protein
MDLTLREAREVPGEIRNVKRNTYDIEYFHVCGASLD